MDSSSLLRKAQCAMADSVKSIATPWVIVVATGVIIAFLATFFNSKFVQIEEHSNGLAEVKTRQDQIGRLYESELKQLRDNAKLLQTQLELLAGRFPAIDQHIVTMSKDTQNLYQLVGDIRTINETMIRYGSRLESLEAAKDLKWLSERVEELRRLMDRFNERFYKIEIEMLQRQDPEDRRLHRVPPEPTYPLNGPHDK